MTQSAKLGLCVGLCATFGKRDTSAAYIFTESANSLLINVDNGSLDYDFSLDTFVLNVTALREG